MYRFFAVGTWRWVDEIEPPQDAVDDLINRLRSELSAFAFDWLRALAVYPAIYGSLTLFLGTGLVVESSARSVDDAIVLEISRLPWLRYGRMPSWLRKRLILDMPSDLKMRVRDLLEALLMTVVSRDPKDFALELSGLQKQKALRTDERLDREYIRNDAILVDFMTRREASPADFRFRSKVARALGLSSAHSRAKDLLGRNDLKAMQVAAEDLKKFLAENPIVHVTAVPADHSECGPDVSEVTEYLGRNQQPVTLTRRLFLLKRNPTEKEAILLDEYSITLWRYRKRLATRFSFWISVILSVIVGAFYANYLDEMFIRKSVHGAMLFLAIIIYAPFPVFWFLLSRPFTEMLQNFPRVQDEISRFVQEE